MSRSSKYHASPHSPFGVLGVHVLGAGHVLERRPTACARRAGPCSRYFSRQPRLPDVRRLDHVVVDADDLRQFHAVKIPDTRVRNPRPRHPAYGRACPSAGPSAMRPSLPSSRSRRRAFPPSCSSRTRSAGAVRDTEWLGEGFAAPDGTISFRVQAFLIEQPGHITLVDPCVGNAKERTLPFWNQLNTPWLERLAATGVAPDAIDLVLHTHLHEDHVGWDTHLADGEWRADVHERAPPLRRRRARVLAVRGAPGRGDDEHRLDRSDLRRRASPTSSRPTPISATACACCRHQGTRPGMPRSRSHRATNAW